MKKGGGKFHGWKKWSPIGPFGPMVFRSTRFFVAGQLFLRLFCGLQLASFATPPSQILELFRLLPT